MNNGDFVHDEWTDWDQERGCKAEEAANTRYSLDKQYWKQSLCQQYQ